MNHNRKSTLVSFLLVATVLLAVAPAIVAQQTAPPKSHLPEIDFLWGVKIPLRDGVHLNATIYKPLAVATTCFPPCFPVSEPLPVIFTLTPYISDSYHERAMYFSQHGYIYALVDVRGRGNSEGHFEPFANEGRDGHDVVEWFAQQPWCNGKVTMWGGSYAGFDQWSTLKEFPPHLVTIVPVASAHAAVDFPFHAGIFGPYDMQWITFTSGVTPQANLFGEDSFWIAKFTELYTKHLPFRELDKLIGNPNPNFQKWLDNPAPGPYWDAMSPTAEDYKRISVPILTITGDYDGDQLGAMAYYRDHMQYGTAEAKANHYLIIGPWDHPGTRTPKREMGGLKFAEASMLDMNKLHQDWYDWTMKSGPKPEFLKKRVAYYVVAAEEWKYADSLESISNEKRVLYLDSDGHANDVFHSGSLRQEKPAAAAADHYVYDPLDTRPAALEEKPNPNYYLDQTGVLNLFGNGLVYHSEPFPEATEISGNLKLTAWISMDVPDTDFEVNVFEILPDGTSIYLTGDAMRARYRESLREAKLAKPGEINRYEFNSFMFFSRRIAKGSRLRLVIDCPNSIQSEKNYNSGGVVAQESGKDARTAHITLYHDAQHPAALEVPIVK